MALSVMKTVGIVGAVVPIMGAMFVSAQWGINKVLNINQVPIIQQKMEKHERKDDSTYVEFMKVLNKLDKNDAVFGIQLHDIKVYGTGREYREETMDSVVKIKRRKHL